MSGMNVTHLPQLNHLPALNADQPQSDKTQTVSPVDDVKKYEKMNDLVSMALSVTAGMRPNNLNPIPELPATTTGLKDPGNIYEKTYGETPRTEKDYSSKDEYLLDRTRAMQFLHRMLAQVIVSDSLMLGQRMIAKQEQAFVAAAKIEETGKVKAYTSFTSAAAGLTVAGASTAMSFKSQAKHMKTESSISSGNDNLSKKNIANRKSDYENSQKIKELNRTESQKLKQDDINSRKLGKEIQEKHNENLELNNQLAATDKELALAKNNGNQGDQEALTVKQNEIKDKINRNNESVRQKEESLAKIDQKRDERRLQFEQDVDQLEMDRNRLREDCEINQGEIDKNNAELSKARNEQAKAQSLHNFTAQLQNPVKALVEAPGELQVAGLKAEEEIARTNSDTLNQTTRAVNENINLNKDLMNKLKSSMEEVMRNNDNMTRTMLVRG